jgi:phthalate 4,5-dioxygenase reductase subunit
VSRVFIAGGIGITPIMAMIHELEGSGGPPWKLWYLTRSPAHTAFREELAPHRGKVVIHHDGGDPDRTFDLWPVLEQPKGRHVHCCGPRGLMQAVRDMDRPLARLRRAFRGFREWREAAARGRRLPRAARAGRRVG